MYIAVIGLKAPTAPFDERRVAETGEGAALNTAAPPSSVSVI